MDPEYILVGPVGERNITYQSSILGVHCRLSGVSYDRIPVLFGFNRGLHLRVLVIVGLLGPVWMCHWCPRFHPMGLTPRSTECMSYMCMWKDDQDAGDLWLFFFLSRQSQREGEPGIGVAGSRFDSEALAVALFYSSSYDHLFRPIVFEPLERLSTSFGIKLMWELWEMVIISITIMIDTT